MNLRDLDETTRAAMLSELDRDLATGPGSGDLYLSPRLTLQGRNDYPDLLREAIRNGSSDTLAAEIATPGRLLAQETARNPRGGPDIVKKVPVNASQLMAEGEFGRYYARGICARALTENGPDATVTIYRARASANPRPESLALDGTTQSAAALLDDLRTHIGIDTALGLPPGPNSGLSICL